MTAQQIKAINTAADNGQLPDDKNPLLVFSGVSVEMLCKIANGELDAIELAKYQLQNMGLDNSGQWIGFGK